VEEAWDLARRIFEALEFSSAACELQGYSTLRWKSGVETTTELWTLTVPLTHEGRAIGKMQLTRPMHDGPLLFRVSAVLQFFANDFSARMSQLLVTQAPESRLKKAAGAR
jgi:hypothetical protein